MVTPSPWTNPFYFFGRVSGDRQFDDLIEERSSPLLPPDIPVCNRNGTVDEDYDPRADEARIPFFQFGAEPFGVLMHGHEIRD